MVECGRGGVGLMGGGREWRRRCKCGCIQCRELKHGRGSRITYGRLEDGQDQVIARPTLAVGQAHSLLAKRSQVRRRVGVHVGQRVDVALRVATAASLVLQVQLVGLIEVILLQAERMALSVQILLLAAVHCDVIRVSALSSRGGGGGVGGSDSAPAESLGLIADLRAFPEPQDRRCVTRY